MGRRARARGESGGEGEFSVGESEIDESGPMSCRRRCRASTNELQNYTALKSHPRSSLLAFHYLAARKCVGLGRLSREVIEGVEGAI